QYEELRARGDLRRAVIICEAKDGDFQVLAQGMNLEEIAGALMAAAAGVTHARETELGRARETKLGDPAPESGPPPKSERTGRKREPEIKRDADGNLTLPHGETFVVCAECGATKWFATIQEFVGALGRLACTSCGNELLMTQSLHSEGHA